MSTFIGLSVPLSKILMKCCAVIFGGSSFAVARFVRFISLPKTTKGRFVLHESEEKLVAGRSYQFCPGSFDQ